MLKLQKYKYVVIHLYLLVFWQTVRDVNLYPYTRIRFAHLSIKRTLRGVLMFSNAIPADAFFTTSQANNLHPDLIAAPIRPLRDSDECRLADACNAIQSRSILHFTPLRLSSRRWLRYQSRQHDKQGCVQYRFTEANIVDDVPTCFLSSQGNNVSRKVKNLYKL